MVQYVSFLLLFATNLPTIVTFTVVPNFNLQATTSIIPLSLLQREHNDDAANDNIKVEDDKFTTRRELFHSVAEIGTAVLLSSVSLPITAGAAPLSDDVTTTAIAMKTFVDPEGTFIINIPQRFFAIRRTNQGDLPNAATGSGRRGSSIFNAGDLAKAEVVAVERYVFLF